MRESTVAKVAVAVLVFAVCIMAESRQLIAGDPVEGADRHEAVVAMGPVGYWPADEGEGDILHDRSGNDNHGKIFHMAWEDDLLNFTNGFHWAEIPSHAAYQGEAFTMGGWLFSRARIVDSDVYAWSDDGGETFHRADGTEVKLPLTVNPAPAHHANVHSNSTERRWGLWPSPLRHAGH